MSTPPRPAGRRPSIDDEVCRGHAPTMELVGRRWNSAILLALGKGAERFVEIDGSVEGISDRMLSLRLKELRDAGLVTRTVVPTMPVQIRYSLTERGRDLLLVLRSPVE